mmetsp:Transcript_6903/g.12678  ORF Transcript_6903/g.12678 Transcript_6903/m.12678 type:complete len:252 (-) Transcript_6903:191-946(-)
MATTPLLLYKSAPFFTIILDMKALNRFMSSSPSRVKPTEDTELSCSCSASKLTNSSSFARTRSREKPPILIILFKSTREYFVSIIFASELSPRIAFLTASKRSLSTRSVLLSSRISANATCSTASFSPVFSSFRRSIIHLQSTTVMIPSIRNEAATSSSAKKVCATGAGSAIPVVSMMTPSNFLPPWMSLPILLSVLIRSPRTVQQMQPLFISTMSSSSLNLLRTSWSSMPTAPNSFSITAYLFSFCSERM